MAETIKQWQDMIADIDERLAALAQTGAAAVSGFDRSQTNVTAAQLQRQRAFAVARLNLLVDPDSAFGTVKISRTL